MKELSAKTLFVTNVPYSVTNDEFQQFFQNIGPTDACFLVATPQGASKGFGFVTFTDASVPANLIAQKKPLYLGSRKIRIELAQKRTKKDEKSIAIPNTAPVSVSRSQAPSIALPVPRLTVKSHRLILRNLSFKITEAILRMNFEKFGKLMEVVLPLKSGKPCGYAFLQFKHKTAATKCIENMNGQNLEGRPIAIDWAVKKTDYERLKDNADPSILDDNSADDSISESMQSETETIDQLSEEEEEQNSLELTREKVPIIKPRKNFDDTTFFIKNLLFEASEDDLRQKFDSYGSLNYIKIVKDTEGRNRGSAFVCFKEKEAYERCLKEYQDACNLVQVQKTPDHKARTSLAHRSLLAELAPAWLLHGRWIDLMPCIDKDIANRKAQESLLSKREADKRNLFLLRESFLNPKSDLIPTMNSDLVSKRIKSQEQRKYQLKDPMYYVSRTRLIIHNLPLNLDEKSLKQVLLNAVDIYMKSYKSDFVSLDPCIAALNEALSKKPVLKQVKVMRSKERKAMDGDLRSLGYAFAEFSLFGHALACLRQVNADSVSIDKKKPFAEFAIENSKIVANRNTRNNEAPFKKVSEKSATNSQPAKRKSSDRKLHRETKKHKRS